MEKSPVSVEQRNLKIVKSYLKAFGEGKPATMSKYLADDALFEIPGPKSSAYSQHIRGKKNIYQFYVRREKTRSKFISTTRVIPRFTVSKNNVIAEWIVEGVDKIEKREFSSSGTNHFVLGNDGKIKSVRIFINAPLSPMVKSLDEDRLLVSDQGRLALMAWSVV